MYFEYMHSHSHCIPMGRVLLHTVSGRQKRHASQKFEWASVRDCPSLRTTWEEPKEGQDGLEKRSKNHLRQADVHLRNAARQESLGAT